jgi:hypothetical protein
MAKKPKKPKGAAVPSQAAARPFTPLQVYNAFPGTDSGPVPPEEGEDFDTYYARIRDKPNFDRLFEFVLDHLCGNYNDTREECESDLDMAIDDLVAVKSALFADQGRRRHR